MSANALDRRVAVERGGEVASPTTRRWPPRSALTDAELLHEVSLFAGALRKHRRVAHVAAHG